MWPFRKPKPKKPRHQHSYRMAAILPNDVPSLPETEKIRGGHCWKRNTNTYWQCTGCGDMTYSHDGRHFNSYRDPTHIEARRVVLDIDEILHQDPREAFNKLIEYPGVFTVEELNEAFRLVKNYLLQSRTFYMKYVGKWHPGRNNITMKAEWGADFTTCPYCTARYKGEDGCPKCGAPTGE